MNSSETVPESAGINDPGDRPSTPQPFYWSVRRELWENCLIYVAPIFVAIVVSSVSSSARLGCRNAAGKFCFSILQSRAAIEAPYDMAAIMLILTTFIVGVFYCLDGAVRRTPRSQHPVLEIAASIRIDHIALEGHNPAGHAPAGNVWRSSWRHSWS